MTRAQYQDIREHMELALEALRDDKERFATFELETALKLLDATRFEQGVKHG